jgi:hypothetical protein
MSRYVQENIEWMKSGGIGCVFAQVMARNPESVNWRISEFSDYDKPLKDTFIQSIVFPNSDAESVREWALSKGFFVEDVSEFYEGLRIKSGQFVSWVQYFGPDSHVKTRQSPHPMLSFCVKLPAVYHAKVGFNGVLHLAHATVKDLSERAKEAMWKRSFVHTEKQIGHKPTIAEAAKTTFQK